MSLINAHEQLGLRPHHYERGEEYMPEQRVLYVFDEEDKHLEVEFQELAGLPAASEWTEQQTGDGSTIHLVEEHKNESVNVRIFRTHIRLDDDSERITYTECYEYKNVAKRENSSVVDMDPTTWRSSLIDDD